MKKNLLVLVGIFNFLLALAQTSVLVKNVNPQDEGAGLSDEKAFLGTDYVFPSQKKLWKTDGTTAGTVVIKDFSSDNINSISRLTSFGPLVMFTISGTTNQLWKTDGTEAGTVMVKDFGTYTVLFRRSVVGSTLFFGAGDAANGNELWKTDGTEGGTTTVKNIADGSASSNPTSLTALNNKLLFVASTPPTGSALWMSDGTDGGTTLIKDLDPSSTSFANVGEMTVVGSKAFFFFEQSATGREPWVTDGTDDGTFLLKDINSGSTGSFPDLFTAVNNTVYFTAQDALTMQIWATDGTSANTLPFFDLVPNSRSDRYGYLTNCNGKLYFAATTNYISYSTEPYTSNGTTAGTTMLKDITPGPNGSDARGFQYLNGAVYFIANTSATGYELWKTDGTETNTAMVTEIYPGSTAGIGGTYLINGVVNNLLIFSGVDPVHNAEPFVSDGTPSGTKLLKNVQTHGLGSHPAHLTAIGNRLYFSGTTGISDTEPWYSDGTETGTQILKDLESGYSNPFDFVKIDNTNFYFKTYNGNVTNIYKSDGTTAGTVPIVGDVTGEHMVVVNNMLFFVKRDATNGTELWKYEAGVASIVKNINSGSANGFPTLLTAYNNQLYFFANDGTNGTELWTSDGTEAGTTLAVDINSGAAGSLSAEQMTVHAGSLYFFATDGSNTALYKSNGTPAGTVVLKTLSDDDAFEQFYAFGGELFFLKKNTNASNQVNAELWKTNGTDLGTAMVKLILPYTANTDEGYLHAISFFTNGNLFYFYFDQENLFEETLAIHFWRSDGTTAGTTELKSYTFTEDDPGNFDNDASYIARYDNDNVLFTFADATHGQEIWKSDGTVPGTNLAVEMVTGSEGGNPVGLTNFGNSIFYSSASNDDEDELWKIATPGTLPLKLLTFTATKAVEDVQLRWNTINEVNCSHFVVQKSLDGSSFRNMMTVSAFNNNAANEYTCLDAQPNTGDNYYRLKMVDLDGKSTYSIVIKIEFGNERKLVVAPNPATDNVIISGNDQIKSIRLFDMAGKLSKQIAPNSANRYSIKGMSKGTYIVQLITTNGTVQTSKLIIE